MLDARAARPQPQLDRTPIPQTEAEFTTATNRILRLHGGQHLVDGLNEVGISGARRLYPLLRNEALVNCARALGIPEDWALSGTTRDQEFGVPRFSPFTGEPLDTPEARLAYFELDIVAKVRLLEGQRGIHIEPETEDVKSLRRLQTLMALDWKLGPASEARGVGKPPVAVRVDGSVGLVTYGVTPGGDRMVQQAVSAEPSSREAKKGVNLTGLTCPQCASPSLHCQEDFFAGLTPPGGERPLFTQIVVSPEDKVVILQGFDSAAILGQRASVALHCESCNTNSTLPDPLSAESFLQEFQRYYRSLGYRVIIQAKKSK